jgi:N-acyl-D-amino-acid deacylase
MSLAEGGEQPPAGARVDRRAFLSDAARAAAAIAAGGLPLGAFEPRRSSRPRAADWVLRGAVVYDGTGRPPVEADVAVAGGRIEAVGSRLAAPGAREMNLAGLALAPGFIDIHSHTDLVLLVDPLAQSKIRQGVTTEIAGQDGSSVGPWSDAEFEETRDTYRSRYGVELDFRDLGGFFQRLRRQGASVNLASMVGHGTVRAAVMGEASRPATAAERERMAALVADALRGGACGLSSGLEYLPGAFADLEELSQAASPLAAAGLPYATHLRNEDDFSLAAVEEALNVGRRAGCPVHISHLKAQGARNWWKGPALLELFEALRASGRDASYDCYPYVAYATGLSNLFPVWARDGGTDRFLARLEDPEQAARIKDYVLDKVDQLGSWDAVQISSTASDGLAWARGRRLGELATERRLDPYELLVQLTRQDRNRTGMIGFGMSEENVERMLAGPSGMICSDGAALAASGPLARGTPHPRNFGTFPRVLGRYCRERRIMPLETAIHKMTGMPAARLKLEGRGVIAPGAAADLVAFDPATVADRATFEEPHQYPVGIPHVMVNGQWVILGGEHTGAKPGQVLRPAR